MSDSTIATAPHETTGIITWPEHGDAPFWASVKLYRAADGGGSYTLEIDGEEIDVTLGYKKEENISPRPQDAVERIRPAKIYWREPDGRRFGGHIKPSFAEDEFRQYQPDKPFKARDKIFTPPDLGEATRFQIQAGKYAEPRYYANRLPEILEALAREIGVGWNRSYLRGRPDSTSSTIWHHARTVRISREYGTKLVRPDGVLKRLGQILGSDPLKGSRIQYDEDHREGVDWRHSVELNDKAAKSLFPVDAPGVEIKVYHPKHKRSEKARESDPLYHPRLEVMFKKKLNSGRGRSFADADDLATKLEEILVNILLWGDVPIEPGPSFVADEYQDVEASDRPIRLFDDPTPQLERDQKGDLVRALVTATGQDVERLGVLLEDGGRPTHRDDVEERLDVSTSTYYRFVDRLSSLLESDNGVLKFISEHQRQLALDVLEPLRAEIDSRARAIAKLVDLNPMLVAKKGASFQTWLTKYAIDVVEEDGKLRRFKIESVLDRFRSTSRPRLEDVLEEGLEKWSEIGLDVAEFYSAIVTYRAPDGSTRSTRVENALV